MEGNGFIRVTAEQKDVVAPLMLSHGEVTPGRYVCLAVIDSGRGFEEGVARRVFEPFFTTRLGGTGLGLATVHEIVRDHDGAMNVQSKPGHGSRFEAWLPAAVTGSAAVDDPEMLPLGRGETVFIVDSERERLLRDEEMLAALARALHEFMPRRPMLFATTPTTDVSADALAEAGIAEVLSRPLVSSEVAAALARCLRPPGLLRT